MNRAKARVEEAMEKGLSDNVVNKMRAEYHLKKTAFQQTNEIIRFPEEKKRKRVDAVKAVKKRKQSNVPEEQQVTIFVSVPEASALHASQKEIEAASSVITNYFETEEELRQLSKDKEGEKAATETVADDDWYSSSDKEGEKDGIYEAQMLQTDDINNKSLKRLSFQRFQRG